MIKYITTLRFCDDSKYLFYVNDKEVGSFMVSFHEDHKEIWGVNIKEGFRGMGYGTQMMQELVSYFGSHRTDFGCSKTNMTLRLKCLVHNDAAVRIYQKSGFEIIEYSNCLPHDTYATYIMQKTY